MHPAQDACWMHPLEDEETLKQGIPVLADRTNQLTVFPMHAFQSTGTPLLRIVRRLLSFAVPIVLLIGCSEQNQTPPDRAQRIIQQTLEAHGSNKLDNSVVTFDFRGARFTVRHEDGLYRYERSYVDSFGRTVSEVLSNDSLYRTVNGERQNLSQSQRLSVETTVNSVVYFALLPYSLNDPAVQPRHLGTDSIRGEPYHEIEVTFRREGGGRDWEDRFIYWIHQEKNTMDYLAYYFHTSGGGSRFRDAVNVRRINGVRFADYLNYTAAVDTVGTAVEQYDQLFRKDGLEKVSEVRLRNVQVKLLQ